MTLKLNILNGVKVHPLGPSFAFAAAGLHRRPVATGAPRGTRNYSTPAASPSPARACSPPPASPSYSLDLILFQRCSWAYHSRPLLKAYDEAAQYNNTFIVSLLHSKKDTMAIEVSYILPQ